MNRKVRCLAIVFAAPIAPSMASAWPQKVQAGREISSQLQGAAARTELTISLDALAPSLQLRSPHASG